VQRSGLDFLRPFGGEFCVTSTVGEENKRRGGECEMVR
jgi:hypothetical protein